MPIRLRTAPVILYKNDNTVPKSTADNVALTAETQIAGLSPNIYSTAATAAFASPNFAPGIPIFKGTSVSM